LDFHSVCIYEGKGPNDEVLFNLNDPQPRPFKPPVPLELLLLGTCMTWNSVVDRIDDTVCRQSDGRLVVRDVLPDEDVVLEAEEEFLTSGSPGRVAKFGTPWGVVGFDLSSDFKKIKFVFVLHKIYFWLNLK
jgi:hypothetical protein